MPLPERSNFDSPPAPAAKLAPLALMVGAVHIAGVFAAVALGNVKGWCTDSASGSTSALLGALPVAVGSLIGLALLKSPTARTPAHLGARVLAASAARMIIAILVGTLFFFMANPQAYVFFAALVTCFFLALAAETHWAVSALKRMAPHAPPSAQPSTGATAR